MVDSAKITEKASELAGQAAAAAGPLKDRAVAMAEQAAAAAGPLMERAEELLDKAGEMAAHGMNTMAESLDKATGGKYSSQISMVTTKLGERLDPGQHHAKPSDGATGQGPTDNG